MGLLVSSLPGKFFYAILSCCFTFNLLTLRLYFLQYQRLPSPYKSNCTQRVLPQIPRYTRDGCFYQCLANTTAKICGCRMIGVPREYSVQFSTIPNLRSKRFRAFSEQTARSKSKIARVKELGGAGKKGTKRFFLPSPPPPPSFFFLALVPFLVRPKPKIPLLGLPLIRNQTEAKPFLAEQSSPWGLLRTLRRKRGHSY